ncbi:MAG: sensor histidine kinase [Pseudomonadota bacterium]
MKLKHNNIALVIIVCFVVTFVIFSGATYFLIQKNIIEETTAVMNQAKVMQQRDLSIDDMMQVLSESPHLSVETFFGRLDYNSINQNTLSDDELLTAEDIQPILMPISENSYLIVSADNRAELAQNMSFFYLVLGLFVFSLGFLLWAIQNGIKNQLKPLNTLAQGLQLISSSPQSEFGQVTLPPSDRQEIQAVFDEYQQLYNALMNKEVALTVANQRIAMLQEEERSYLAQELHDNVGQLLTSAKAYAHILTSTKDMTVVRESAIKVKAYCQEISDAIRKLTNHLHPLSLDKVSLEQSLRKLISEQHQCLSDTHWKVDIQMSEYPQSHERDVHVYRIVQEALNNLVKYAGPNNVVVSIVFFQDVLNVVIRDDGVGFSQNTAEGLGLTSMQNRAKCIGGHLSIESSLGNGTEVSLEVTIAGQGIKDISQR